MNLPHPLPYQGSKRKLAPVIGQFIEKNCSTWYEPFAGSIAMTIWAASHNVAHRYVIGDSLTSICHLWEEIIENPHIIANRYREIWEGQIAADNDYFYRVRERYNSNHDPVDLLYLICRCVKNAVRFNKHGAFTQSVDKRRLGTRPDKMEKSILSVSAILKGKTEIRSGDWLKTLADATSKDYIYLDPPYFGTSTGRDRRYAHQIEKTSLIFGLKSLTERKTPFSLSYDGMTGGREYCTALPDSLGMTRLLLHAGVSTQSTLNGCREETIESLYVWPKIPHHNAKAIGQEANSRPLFAFQ